MSEIDKRPISILSEFHIISRCRVRVYKFPYGARAGRSMLGSGLLLGNGFGDGNMKLRSFM